MSSAFEHPRIAVSDLTMAYGDSVVMQDLNFTVNEREIFVIMGGSGSGKSTLLRHLVGLQEPARGTISYQGTSAGLWEMTPPERERLMRRFGLLYQGGALWSSMTLAENIALPLQEYVAAPADEIFAIADNSVFLDGESKTMIASGNPKKLLAGSKDPRVRAFLTRGEEMNGG